MGKATDIAFTTVRNTGHGSAHYGVCEICKKATHLIYCAELQRVYQRENGDYYLSPAAASIYGDMPCLLERYGTLRRDEDFERVGCTKCVTPAQFAELQRLHDNAMSTANGCGVCWRIQQQNSMFLPMSFEYFAQLKIAPNPATHVN